MEENIRTGNYCEYKYFLNFKSKEDLIACLDKLYDRYRMHIDLHKYETSMNIIVRFFSYQARAIENIILNLENPPRIFQRTVRKVKYEIEYLIKKEEEDDVKVDQ